MAASALGRLARPHPLIIAALEEALQGSEQQVALACARALCSLGKGEHAALLLGSPHEVDQERAFEALRYAKGLPESVKTAFCHGKLCNPWSLRLLPIHLSSAQQADWLAQAWPLLSPEQRSLVIPPLARLGIPALDFCLEQLRHPDPHARGQALDVLEQALPLHCDSHLQWLADHGSDLPLEDGALEDGDDPFRARLHQVLSSFLDRSHSWKRPNTLPLVAALTRSFDFQAAGLAVGCLAKAYHSRTESSLAELLFQALQHPHRAVRWEAAQALQSMLPDSQEGRDLARRIATLPPDPDPLVQAPLLELRDRLLGP